MQRSLSFRESIIGMADQYDMIADSISSRCQGLLTNLTDKKQKCEKKMSQLKARALQSATDESSTPDMALDLSVLESEASRVAIYDKQI